MTLKHFRVIGKLLQVMKACVLYVSRTGNTKRLAEAISELLKAPVHDITRNIGPSDVDGFDLLVIGTPVMGLGPAGSSDFCQALAGMQRQESYSFLHLRHKTGSNP